MAYETWGIDRAMDALGNPFSRPPGSRPPLPSIEELPISFYGNEATKRSGSPAGSSVVVSLCICG